MNKMSIPCAPVFASCDILISDGTVCQNGWIGFEGFCYKFSVDEVMFDEAVAACLQEEAQLTSVLSQSENDFLAEIITTSKFAVHFVGKHELFCCSVVERKGKGICLKL